MKKFLRTIIIIIIFFLGNIISGQNVIAASDKSKNFRIERDINMEGVLEIRYFSLI